MDSLDATTFMFHKDKIIAHITMERKDDAKDTVSLWRWKTSPQDAETMSSDTKKRSFRRLNSHILRWWFHLLKLVPRAMNL